MFPICIVSNAPPWDALPVAKIVHFSSATPIQDRIYAQAQLCYVPEKGLFVRLWSFETPPLPEDDRYLRFSFTLRDGASYSVDVPPSYKKGVFPLAGEDLQGIFWGGEFLLENSFLCECFQVSLPIKPGFSFQGNLSNHALADASYFPDATGEFRFISF